MANINIPDSALFQAGAGPDLKLTHDGTNSTISNATGTLTINNIASASLILGTANTTAVTIDNSQNTTFANNITIPAGNAFFLDGGGNSKVEEFAADAINIQAGGSNFVVDGRATGGSGNSRAVILGVGTTTPKSHVDFYGKGGISINSSDVILTNHIYFDASGNPKKSADAAGSAVVLTGGTVMLMYNSTGDTDAAAAWNEGLRVTTAGNVGIGAAPDSASRLLVDHDQNAYTRILVKNTDTGSAAQSVTHYETSAGSFTCGAVSDEHSLDGAALLWHVPNKSMVFATNNTLAFTIDNSQEGVFSGALHVGSNQSDKEMFTVKGYNNRVMRLKTLGSDRQWQWGLNTGSAMYYSVKNYSGSGSTYFGVGVCPAQYHLDVAGDIGYTGSITDYSLRELKKDIVEIDGTGMIDKLKKLPLYKYNMKTSSMQRTSDDPVYAKNKGRYGLIADDEVNRTEFPELINWSKREDEEKPKVTGVDTTSYIGILHGAIKELISKVEALENG